MKRRRAVSLADLVERAMRVDIPTTNVEKTHAAIGTLGPNPTTRDFTVGRLRDLTRELHENGRATTRTILDVWRYAWRLGVVTSEPPELESVNPLNPCRETILERSSIVRKMWKAD